MMDCSTVGRVSLISGAQNAISGSRLSVCAVGRANVRGAAAGTAINSRHIARRSARDWEPETRATTEGRAAAEQQQWGGRAVAVGCLLSHGSSAVGVRAPAVADADAGAAAGGRRLDRPPLVCWPFTAPPGLLHHRARPSTRRVNRLLGRPVVPVPGHSSRRTNLFPKRSAPMRGPAFVSMGLNTSYIPVSILSQQTHSLLRLHNSLDSRLSIDSS